MSVVRQLYQLQIADSERDGNSQQLEELLGSLGLSGEVVKAREAVAESSRHRQESKAALRALELEISSLEAKLKANQERLYGGKVRSPKELSGLEDEAKALRRRKSELEDQQLELMIRVDAHEAEVAERQARLRQIEVTWQEQQVSLEAQKEQLELRLVELDDLRLDLRARIPRLDLETYDDLRDSLGGTAVALLKRGICQVCGVDVPIEESLAVQRGEGAHVCPVCGRLLYGGG